MRVAKYLGKLLAISKGIHFTKPPSFERMSVFRTGEGTPVGLRVVSWWVTHNTVVETRQLAAMIKEDSSEYAEVSIAAIQIEIDRIFEGNLFNAELFQVDKILNGVPTLFDAIAEGDKDRFARRLWDKINDAVEKLQPQWLVLYPLKHVVAGSADLGFDCLQLLAPTDSDMWLSFSSRYPRTTTFSPAEGSPERIFAPTVWGIDSPTANESSKFTWLICEANGTESDVVNIVADRMRTLLALLFAHWHPSRADFFMFQSALDGHRLSFQFAPAGTRNEKTIIPRPIGRLMPTVMIDLQILPGDLTGIRSWYKAFSSADELLQQRAIAASQFIHHAIVADGIGKFIHYYIALDAMFGERHQVEEKIKDALLRMFPDEPLWAYRADRLFDLRNDLVHGGTSSIRRWKGFQAYMRHVQTSPLEDVCRAAMTALRRHFNSSFYIGTT